MPEPIGRWGGDAHSHWFDRACRAGGRRGVANGKKRIPRLGVGERSFLEPGLERDKIIGPTGTALGNRPTIARGPRDKGEKRSWRQARIGKRLRGKTARIASETRAGSGRSGRLRPSGIRPKHPHASCWEGVMAVTVHADPPGGRKATWLSRALCRRTRARQAEGASDPLLLDSRCPLYRGLPETLPRSRRSGRPRPSFLVRAEDGSVPRCRSAVRSPEVLDPERADAGCESRKVAL
jgi:hypothetical protein